MINIQCSTHRLMQAVAIENSYPVSSNYDINPANKIGYCYLKLLSSTKYCSNTLSSLTDPPTEGWISGGWGVHWQGGPRRPYCNDAHHRRHAWRLLPQGPISPSLISLKASSRQASSYEFMAESSRQGSTAYWWWWFNYRNKCFFSFRSHRLLQVFDGVCISEQVSLPHPVHGGRQEGRHRQPRGKLETWEKCSTWLSSPRLAMAMNWCISSMSIFLLYFASESSSTFFPS